MDIRFSLDEDATLTEAQTRERKVSANYPYIEDADSPEIVPQKNPKLWKKALEALPKRNRRMAKRMA